MTDHSELGQDLSMAIANWVTGNCKWVTATCLFANSTSKSTFASRNPISQRSWSCLVLFQLHCSNEFFDYLTACVLTTVALESNQSNFYGLDEAAWTCDLLQSLHWLPKLDQLQSLTFFHSDLARKVGARTGWDKLFHHALAFRLHVNPAANGYQKPASCQVFALHFFALSQ